jgi:hypothetical protein
MVPLYAQLCNMMQLPVTITWHSYAGIHHDVVVLV